VEWGAHGRTGPCGGFCSPKKKKSSEKWGTGCEVGHNKMSGKVTEKCAEPRGGDKNDMGG